MSNENVEFLDEGVKKEKKPHSAFAQDEQPDSLLEIF